MKLKELRRGVQQEIHTLFEKADEMEPMEFMDSVHELNLIARFATIALYRARETREKDFQWYISHHDNVCIIVGDPPTMGAATQKFLDGLQLGSAKPLNLRNLRKGGIEGADWIHFATNLITRFKEVSTHPETKPKLEHPIFYLSETPQELRDKILALPDLLKETANEWAKCMRDLFFQSPEAKNFPEIHQEILNKAETYAEDSLNERQLRRQSKLNENYPGLIEKYQEKMEDFAFDELQKFKMKKEEIDRMTLSKGDLRKGVYKYVKERLKQLLSP